jgi:dTDP-glucose 4,6-dehydratase
VVGIIGVDALTGTWPDQRVLVTGAGGFIGSHLVEHLAAAGAQVRAFVRYTSRNDRGWLEGMDPELAERVDIFRGDLQNPEAVDRAAAGCDTVFHLGALIPIPYSYVHPREFVTTNVEGTLNVLEACRRHRIARLVHTSTSEVYGSAITVPIDEDHPLRAQSPYAATKTAADQLALSFWRSFETPVVVARPFNTFGPRQSARAVIPTIITQALTRDVIELGSVSTTRDFNFVDDTVAGFLACGATPGVEGEVLNLGTGVEVTVADVVGRVLAVLEREIPVVAADERMRPPASEVVRLIADADKANRLLGWAPRTSLDDALRTTVEWFRANAGRYRPADYGI